VRILFDVGTPAPLARYLRGHEVVRTGKLGWEKLKNGRLLDACESQEFDLLLTCDQSIPYQQNFTGRKLAVVVLNSNNWPLIKPVAARIATQVDFVQRGQIMFIDVKALR
jgi:hypothetical protein